MTAPTNSDTETTPSRAIVVSDVCSAGRVLRLTLKRKWFDMIASGEKTEEYRTPSKWIFSRLIGKDYDVVEFSNGYGKDVPKIVVQFFGWHQGYGVPEWGAFWQDRYVVIRLGRVLYRQNTEGLASPARRC